MRLEINEADFCVPASNDIVAAFGCDLEVDDEFFVETYTFRDELGQPARIWLGTVDRTFSMAIGEEASEAFRITNGRLNHLSIDEDRQLISIGLGERELKLTLNLYVWPRAKVDLLFG